jgi:hypothetical protein
MRVSRSFTALTTSLLVILSIPGSSMGQAGGGGDDERPWIRPPALPIDTLSSPDPGWTNRILTGLAGAAIGAGLGYFASQVATGDWEIRDGRGGIHRPTWTAIGGAGGLLLGVSIPIRWDNPMGGSVARAREERFVISGDAVREALLTNALEAVRHFHPEWLVIRGQQTSADPVIDYIRAYMDNVPIGRVDALLGVEVPLIQEIRFLDSRRATQRWGMGHPYGAIQVVTLGEGGSG